MSRLFYIPHFPHCICHLLSLTSHRMRFIFHNNGQSQSQRVKHLYHLELLCLHSKTYVVLVIVFPQGGNWTLAGNKNHQKGLILILFQQVWVSPQVFLTCPQVMFMLLVWTLPSENCFLSLVKPAVDNLCFKAPSTHLPFGNTSQRQILSFAYVPGTT